MNCSVKGCSDEAAYKVILYDAYPYAGGVFFEQDFTCPFLCEYHMAENERVVDGMQRCGDYPYTNQHKAQGFTIYQPLE